MRSSITALSLLGGALLLAACEKTVPDVVGDTVPNAEAKVVAAGLAMDQAEVPVQSLHPIDTVAEQRPPGGETLKEGGTVVVTLSSGTTIGDYIGRRGAEAKLELEELGFTVTLADIQAAGVAEGIVAKQVPQPNVPFSAVDGVALSLGVGPWIQVPDLGGMVYANAESALSALALGTSVRGPTDSGQLPFGCNTSRPGRCTSCSFRSVVVRSDPASGTMLFPRDTVQLFTRHEQFACVDEPGVCLPGGGCNPF